jgi:hypothetical protein
MNEHQSPIYDAAEASPIQKSRIARLVVGQLVALIVLLSKEASVLHGFNSL